MRENPDTPVRYQCQRCGKCCQWPGDVWIEDRDIRAISAFLKLSEEAFLEKFTRLTANRRGLSLVEKPSGACVFYENGACAIQPVKPGQCAGFPNAWQFEGWREHCEAIPVPARPGEEVFRERPSRYQKSPLRDWKLEGNPSPQERDS